MSWSKKDCRCIDYLREVTKMVFLTSRKRYMAKKIIKYDNGHICDDCKHLWIRLLYTERYRASLIVTK